MLLYRPVGLAELHLIAASGFRSFPARLPSQPIFYPVLDRDYAIQIARDWNTKDEFSGFAGWVTEFEIGEDFVSRYPVQGVGARTHREIWVPAEDLEEFNRQIIGKIRVVAGFAGNAFQGTLDVATTLPTSLQAELDSHASDAGKFYDDLTPYYHLIFEDWEASMERQGAALARLITEDLGETSPAKIRVLDAACGIGTQTLPLAARGFHLVASDISPQAVTRIRSEASARQLTVDASVADMRRIKDSVSGLFDVVLVLDNALAHLLHDEDLSAALRGFLEILRPGGVFLCSVRDYDKLPRGTATSVDYGTRRYRGAILRLGQKWVWDDLMHYQSIFTIEREDPDGTWRDLSTVSRFYAVSTSRMLELMHDAGFQDCRRRDDVIYQPILIGRKRS